MTCILAISDTQAKESVARMLGDEQQGIALVKASQLQQFATDILKAMRGETEE